MSSNLYRSFLRLLEKWPVDPLKTGRDLGEHLRSGVGVAFRGGSGEPRNTKACEGIHSSLSNIAGNRYKEAFYVSEVKSASGLSQAECRETVSNEFLKLLEDEERTMKEKMVSYFKK